MQKIFFLANVQIQYYSIMIDGQNVFDQPIKSDIRTHDNIKKLQLVKEMIDYTAGSLLDYPYFKDYYKMIAINLSK